MDKLKVLLIDDDTLFGNIVTSFLTEKGFEVLYLNSLMAVTTIISQFCPDIILLDVEVGNDDGVSAIPNIQIVSHETPIMVMSSHTEGSDIYRALKKGVINYLSKPINLELLPAYIERYARIGESVFISIGDCELNLDTRELFVKDALLKILTHREFDLLKILILHKNAVVTFEQIKETWGDMTMSDEHTIYNYIRKVRSLLSDDPNLSLKTVTTGYMLKEF